MAISHRYWRDVTEELHPSVEVGQAANGCGIINIGLIQLHPPCAGYVLSSLFRHAMEQPLRESWLGEKRLHD